MLDCIAFMRGMKKRALGFAGMVVVTTALLVPAQDYVGQFLVTFRDYPQRQKAASFNMDEVMQKLKESTAK
jgi:hypothetical protein